MDKINTEEIIDSVDQEFRDQFVQSVDSKMNVKIDYEKQSVDYDWLDQFEETIHYIDNILRNPKRFIINEEEIVKIEQAKKITVESVIHLTQHTNLIQDINEKGDVRPSKILNINKEESLDTYENRFIYTLIKQMNYFFEMHVGNDSMVKSSYCHDEKMIRYQASAKINNENVKISMDMQSSDNVINTVPSKNGMSLEDRLKKIKMQLSAFNESELIKVLTKLHVPIVRPPIRKTNVILKNPNFQKAEQLWNFIYSYESKDSGFVKDKKEFTENGYVKSQFDQSFLLNYLALNSLSKDTKKKVMSDSKVMGMTVGKIIEAVLDVNEDISEDDFKKIVNREFYKAKRKISDRDEIICRILNERMKKMNRKFDDMIDILK